LQLLHKRGRLVWVFNIDCDGVIPDHWRDDIEYLRIELQNQGCVLGADNQTFTHITGQAFLTYCVIVVEMHISELATATFVLNIIVLNKG